MEENNKKGSQVTDKYDFYIKKIREALAEGQSFDVLERKISVGGRDASLFFVDGLTKANNMQFVMSFLLKVKDTDMERVANAEDFLKYSLPFLDSLAESDVSKVLKQLYSGLVPIVVRGLDQVIIIDARDYPLRGVQEPSKEKSLRAAEYVIRVSFLKVIQSVRRAKRTLVLFI